MWKLIPRISIIWRLGSPLTELYHFCFGKFFSISEINVRNGQVHSRPCGLIRVLSRSYRLGEKSRVAEAHKHLCGIRRHAPAPEIFWNKYALRCNLVHFETQFWGMLQWYFIFSREHVPCHIVSLDKEYLLHVHGPRRVWMIFLYVMVTGLSGVQFGLQSYEWLTKSDDRVDIA